MRTMPVERSPKGAGGPPPEAERDQDAFWTKMRGILGGMECRLKQETEEVKERLGDLGGRVEKAERRLEGITDEVHKIVDMKLASTHRESPLEPPKELGAGVGRDSVAVFPSYAAAAMAKPQSWKSPKRRDEDRYWDCRKQLRVRPVEGSDVEGAVRNFLVQNLKIEDIDSLGNIVVQRIPHGPGSKIKNEALVTFGSVEARDVVKGAARNLAGKGPEYGVRLELPNHLKSAMRAVQAVSYEIKKRYPGARRNVLFDDETMDVVLDFCVSEGGSWKRLSSGQARERKRKTGVQGGLDRTALDDGELDRLLEESDP